MKRVLFSLLAAAFLFSGGCGYELIQGPGMVVNTSTPEGKVPITVTSVYVPVFKNATLEPQVPMFFTEAFSRELAASGLVSVNKAGADATLQGSVVSVGTALSSLSGQGLAIGKSVSVTVNLTLVRQGKVIASWSFGDSETYDVSTVNSEEFNKRAALGRLAERMARRFHALLVAALRA